MKKEELRIGNYVGFGVIHTGLGQEESTAHYTVSYLTEEAMFFKESNVGEYYDDVAPIQLTEDWMLKFGFIREGDWIGIIFNARIGIRFYDGNPAECDIIQDDKFISFKFEHIKYIHELQNLYFVLSGNELTL